MTINPNITMTVGINMILILSRMQYDLVFYQMIVADLVTYSEIPIAHNDLFGVYRVFSRKVNGY